MVVANDGVGIDEFDKTYWLKKKKLENIVVMVSKGGWLYKS